MTADMTADARLVPEPGDAASSAERPMEPMGPAGSARAAAAIGDLALLRRFEPILRYNEGELFFPSPVETYLAECDLWVGSSQRQRTLLVPRGELTPDLLATFETPPGQSLFLRLVQAPLTPLELARWSRRPGRPVFRAPSRLARVGIVARLIDAGFNVSLLLRGTVPGGTAAAAQIKYESSLQRDPRYVYHGRVVRSGGWTVLHYMYFYFMNDWRSTFQGANDHEADLEQSFVFLEEGPDGPTPVWFACAAHDYSGDDLRRRWDDPYLVRHGDHPVIHAGAGSHAAYFEQGEYLTAAPIPAARVLRGVLEALRGFWRDTLRQDDPGDLATRIAGALSIPFIDYARADGRSIGPDQQLPWSPVLIDDATPWVDGYRGLWGLDTYDRFAGERAPAGPKWNRAGIVRQTWHDPVGWAGLAKVATPSRAPAALEDRIAAMESELIEIRANDGRMSAGLPGLELEVRALAGSESYAALHETRAGDLARAEAELANARRREAALLDEISASRRELERIRAGDFGDPRAHIGRDHHPVPPELTRYGRAVELWSAVSISLVLFVIVASLATRTLGPIASIILGVGLYLVLDAAFRRRLGALMLRVTILLAVVATLILAYTFATAVIIALIVGLAVFTLADNVREVSRR
jgi:hypothetical protein